jgi:hypothetical protein
MTKKILFVSNTSRIDNPYDDPSTRYRCYTPASALRNNGYITAVTSQSDFGDGSKYEDFFDFFVFHRPNLTENLVQFLDKNKRSNRIIADYDDLIFDVSQSKLMPSYRFRGINFHDTSMYLAANAAANRYFYNFTFSTEPLAERARALFGDINAVVVSNSLDAGYLTRAKAIRENTEQRPFQIGYFAGTATHDADLAFISHAIAAKLNKEPTSKMLLLGPAAIPDPLLSFRDRIHHQEQVVHFTKLPYEMSQVETVVAPLEWNEFTVCKSGLKFFEAALVGCSVVATPIPDIDRFSSKMLRKCTAQDEWMDALSTPFDLTPEEIEMEVVNFAPLIDAELTRLKYEGIFANES